MSTQNIEIKLLKLSKQALDNYLKQDWILKQLQELKEPLGISDQWLKEIPLKRLMFDMLYSELIKFNDGGKAKILDIGTGQTELLPKLCKRLNITFLDPEFNEDVSKEKFHIGSWETTDLFSENHYWDIVTCNDVFPNVDNRIIHFLEVVLPRTQKLKMTLTAHNMGKKFKTITKEDGEKLSWQAWDQQILLFKLGNFFDLELWKDVKLIDTNSQLLDDGRLVYYLEVTKKN